MGWDTLIGLVSLALLLGMGLIIGGYRERSHLRSLHERERATADMLITNLRTPTEPDRVTSAELVGANVVIASDYLKTFLSGYRKLLGGEMRAYAILAQRARREAVLRVVEQARALGAREVWNLRLETANIGGLRTQGGVMCEAMAYGTAVIRGGADGTASRPGELKFAARGRVLPHAQA